MANSLYVFVFVKAGSYMEYIFQSQKFSNVLSEQCIQ